MYLKCKHRRIKMTKKKSRIYTVTGFEMTKWGRDFVATSKEEARAKAMEALQHDGWEYWDEYESSTQFEADKGAMSDAFKRAAVRGGVGRYLYSMGDQWVELDERKRFTESAKINLKAS